MEVHPAPGACVWEIHLGGHQVGLCDITEEECFSLCPSLAQLNASPSVPEDRLNPIYWSRQLRLRGLPAPGEAWRSNRSYMRLGRTVSSIPKGGSAQGGSPPQHCFPALVQGHKGQHMSPSCPKSATVSLSPVCGRPESCLPPS